jgi:hypothetical protein
MMTARHSHFEPEPEDCTEAYAYLNIHDPLIAWLVYRGELVASTQIDPSAVSVWASGYLRDAEANGQRYAAEVAIEHLRATNHPQAVSRLRGLYVFPDRESALEAEQRWGASFRPEFLTELGIRPGSQTSTHDAEWISAHLGRDSSTEWMDAYLGGKPSGVSPIWESLIDGRAWIFGTELREAAYEVVKATWPESLALLELSRIGAWVGSDLGLITALAVREHEDVLVTYRMNFADANDPEFLERVAAPNVEKNTRDLNSESELVLPDLRRRAFRFRPA